jgi:putative hydrolases of HD superfamily
LPNKSSARGPSELFRAAGILKTVQRKGWTKAGITDQESVADHSFRMAIIGAYLSEESKLDSAKVIRMCLIHDLAESVIGDLTPEEKVSEETHRKEEDRVNHAIFSSLSDRERKEFLLDWQELLEMRTREAKLVWQIDKLEMGLTMKDYIRKGGNKEKLSEFNPSSHLTKELRSILEDY